MASNSPFPAAPADRLRPWLLGAMAALLVARPMVPSESAATAGDGMPVVMLWIALAVFWLLGEIGRPRFKIRFGWTDAAVLLLLGLHSLAGIWAAGHASPRPALNMLWEWIALGLTFLLGRQLILHAREARAMVAVMIALAVALSGDGLYQYFYEMPATLAHYEADPDATLREAGLWYAPGSSERELFETRLRSPEPIATFALTNSLAALLTPWLVLLAGIVACGRRLAPALVPGVSSGTSAGAKQRLPAWFAKIQQASWRPVCVLLPIAACLLVTKSRSAYIAALLGLGLVWWLSRPRTGRSRAKMLAAVVGAGVLVAAGLLVVGRFNGELLHRAVTSFAYRVQYWQSSLHLIADHPWLGCGPGNFQDAYTLHKLPDACEEVADPHNFLMEVAATAGLPTLLALLAVLGGFFLNRRNRRVAAGAEPQPPETSGGPLPVADVFLYVGAACGLLLSLPLGLFATAPPGLIAVLLGLPLGGVAIALLRPWIHSGVLPDWLPAAAVAALLVNLLAVGGIGYPGVAGSLWLLLAVGLVGDRPRSLPRAGAFAALLMAAGVTLACFATAYRPVLSSLTAMRLAQQELTAGNLAAYERQLWTAAHRDPLAAEPRRQLAALAMELWRRKPEAAQFERVDGHLEAMLRLAPNSFLAWLAAGDVYFQVFHRTGRPEQIQQAIAAYRRAVELYPTSGLCHAKLALAYQSAGRRSDFLEESATAIKLDQAAPHDKNKKRLPPDLRRRLEPGNAVEP